MIKKLVTIFLAISSITCLGPDHGKETYIYNKFKQFMKDHNKSYPTVQELMSRFEIFKQNYIDMEQFSASDIERSYEVGITKFSDLTLEEFIANYANLKMGSSLAFLSTPSDGEVNKSEKFPESLDWRTKGVVGAVKNQDREERCGACWSFSTVANLEGKYALKHKEQIILSEQELIDCSTSNAGCHGGNMHLAFDYIKKSGLAYSKDYPYIAKQEKCNTDVKPAIFVADYIRKMDNSEETMISILQDGPASVVFNAAHLRHYKSGIIDDDASECNPAIQTHAVTLVGYTPEYWIIRNSWGTDFGEDGYFRVKRGNNTCGINAYIASAVLA